MRLCPQYRPGGRAGGDLTLEALRDNEEVDMFTTVFVGNSQTAAIDGKMVTPGAIGKETEAMENCCCLRERQRQGAGGVSGPAGRFLPRVRGYRIRRAAAG